MDNFLANRDLSVHELALEGDIQAVKNQIGSKPELLTKTDDSSRIPLHWACSKGHKEMVGWLLDQTKDPNPKDDSQWTPLIIAASGGHIDVVKMLMENGADVNAVTDQGRSALLYAASKNRPEIVSLLLSARVDVNKQDVIGQTPLHRAAGPGYEGVVKMLLAADNCIVDVQDRYGNTALYYACEEERLEVAKLLLSAGANPEIKNKEELNPLQKCSPGFERSLLKYLSNPGSAN